MTKNKLRVELERIADKAFCTHTFNRAVFKWKQIQGFVPTEQRLTIAMLLEECDIDYPDKYHDDIIAGRIALKAYISSIVSTDRLYLLCEGVEVIKKCKVLC